jgi:hypothetical protein
VASKSNPQKTPQLAELHHRAGRHPRQRLRLAAVVEDGWTTSYAAAMFRVAWPDAKLAGQSAIETPVGRSAGSMAGFLGSQQHPDTARLDAVAFGSAVCAGRWLESARRWVMRAPYGDFRSWDAVHALTDEIAGCVTSGDSGDVGEFRVAEEAADEVR